MKIYSRALFVGILVNVRDSGFFPCAMLITSLKKEFCSYFVTLDPGVLNGYLLSPVEGGTNCKAYRESTINTDVATLTLLLILRQSDITRGIAVL